MADEPGPDPDLGLGDDGDADFGLGDDGGLDDGGLDDLAGLEDPDEAQKEPDPNEEPPPITGVTRLQMLEYMNQREWWSNSQRRLFFTSLLWGVFAYLAITRSEASQTFMVQQGLEGYMKQIISHPAVSGVRLRTPSETSMPCRCGCRHIGGLPSSTCEVDGQIETFDFFGRLPATEADRIVAASGGAYPQGAQEMEPMMWDKIQSAEDVMIWLEHGLLPDLWGTVAGKIVRRPGLLLNRNLIIGGLRARQTRADTSVEHCELPSGLLSWYTIQCRSDQNSDQTYGPAASGNISEVNAMPPDAREAFTPSRTAALGSGAFDALFDVERPLQEPVATATYLRRHGWLTDSTKSLQLQSLLLNAESGAFALLTVNFEFGYDGVVTKLVKSSVFKVAPTHAGTGYWIPEILWLILICEMFFGELWQMGKLAYAKELSKYFKDFWNILDWISIAVGTAIATYSFWIADLTAQMATNVAALPRAPLPQGLDSDSYRDAWSKSLDDAEFIHTLRGYMQLCLFWYSSIITLRFLKGFLGQAKLAMLQLTLADGFWDTVHFLLMFLVFFNNFVVGGKILFGAEINEWSTYPSAVSTSVVILMGSPRFDQLFEIAPISATIWYWLFLLTMVFLMMNILVVIFVEYFNLLRTAAGDTSGLVHDFKLTWKDFKWRMDWRKDQFSDGEYRECFLGDPYKDLVEGLIENSKIDEDFQEAANHSCLGLQLQRKQLEDLTVDALTPETNPAYALVTSLELRKIACDALTAEHLLEECNQFVAADKSSPHLSQLYQVRNFVNLLKQSKQMLEQQCQQLEDGIVDDQEALEEIMSNLEGSVEACFYGFQELSAQGIDSLAPPALGPGGEMKAALPAMLNTIRAQKPDLLRSTAGFQSTTDTFPPAIGDYPSHPALRN
eukprot:gb/GFBE01041268.1/.p1 GENE.gb/GFBE01041268.1/~~gb/GFBE01041268.1/.p1  ORF type:complete len:900 (+),score=206.50 gb/GFBE01041268.1/:1-2700(+)